MDDLGQLPTCGRRWLHSGCIKIGSFWFSSTVREDSHNEMTTQLAQDPAQVPTRNHFRWRRLLLWSLGIFVVAFVVASLTLFVAPATDLPRHVDGILSLNAGDESAREARAIALAEQGFAHVLLFSQGSPGNDTPCPKVPRVSVVCFVDVTNNTRGEAEWAGRYAEQHHWHSLMIVPGQTQATRARLLTERCFRGQVVTVPVSDPLWDLPGDVVHEWGGLFAALFIYRSC